MVDALFLAVASLCFFIAALQLRWRRSQPTRTPLVVLTTALGLAFVFLSPLTQQIESRTWPSLGRLLSNTATLVAAYGLTLFIAAVGQPRAQARTNKGPSRGLIVLLIAIALLIIMFFSSDTPKGIGVFSGLYRSQPTLAVYSLTYSLYLGMALTDLGWLSARAALSAWGALRIGLTMIFIGSLIGIAYVLAKILDVLQEIFTGTGSVGDCDGAFSSIGCALHIAAPAMSVLIITAGSILPAAAPRAVDAVSGFTKLFGTR
jgi:hypothetical protein